MGGEIRHTHGLCFRKIEPFITDKINCISNKPSPSHQSNNKPVHVNSDKFTPTTEHFLGFLVQIGNSNASSEDSVVRMLCCHGGCCFCCQVVQFHSGDSWIQPVDHLQCDSRLKPVSWTWFYHNISKTEYSILLIPHNWEQVSSINNQGKCNTNKINSTLSYIYMLLYHFYIVLVESTLFKRSL